MPPVYDHHEALNRGRPVLSGLPQRRELPHSSRIQP